MVSAVLVWLLSHLNIGHRATALTDYETIEENIFSDGQPGALREEVVPQQPPDSALQLPHLHPGQLLPEEAGDEVVVSVGPSQQLL